MEEGTLEERRLGHAWTVVDVRRCVVAGGRHGLRPSSGGVATHRRGGKGELLRSVRGAGRACGVWVEFRAWGYEVTSDGEQDFLLYFSLFVTWGTINVLEGGEVDVVAAYFCFVRGLPWGSIGVPACHLKYSSRVVDGLRWVEGCAWDGSMMCSQGRGGRCWVLSLMSSWNSVESMVTSISSCLLGRTGHTTIWVGLVLRRYRAVNALCASLHNGPVSVAQSSVLNF